MPPPLLSLLCFLLLAAIRRFPAAGADPRMSFPKPRFRQAYIALQAWKRAIFSDPLNITATWTGSDVCAYAGVFCAPAVFDPSVTVVAGIDLNHGDIEGHLPPELGLLTDLVLFHINSNRFRGGVPETFRHLQVLFELDLSNNRFVGRFPEVVLSMPSLKYLDLRFNGFEGSIPSELFDKDLDAVFLNDNRLQFGIPANLGNSPVSVLVLANNNLGGCIPRSIDNMGETLHEIILMNDNLTGCLPPEIGKLTNLIVFDVSFNHLQGPLPDAVGNMKSLEQLDVAHNRLAGVITASVCQLPRLHNFTYSFNFVTDEAPECSARGGGIILDGRKNCVQGKRGQRTSGVCSSVAAAKPISCSKFQCDWVGGHRAHLLQRRVIYLSPPAPVGNAHSRGRMAAPEAPPPPLSSESSPSTGSPPPPQEVSSLSSELQQHSPPQPPPSPPKVPPPTDSAATQHVRRL